MDKTDQPIKQDTVVEPEKIEETKAPEEEVKGIDPLNEPYMTNPFFYEVANYFGIEQGDYDATKEKLAAIVEWAYNEVGTKNTGDLLLKIREMEDSIQPPEWGEKRYANVYKYVRLASQKQSVEKAMKALEKEKDERKV